MRHNRQISVTRERVREIIINSEPDITREMVERYTDSELKEWMKLLFGVKVKTNF